MKERAMDDVEAEAVPKDAEEALPSPHHGIQIQCQFCVGRNFRRSRLRTMDVKELLLMRYPVRCLRCSQRQMVSFSVAGISVPSSVKHVPERRGVPDVPVARGTDRPEKG